MIDTGAGVIDADYRGIVYVLLFNLSDKDFQGIISALHIYFVLRLFLKVEEGDRVAQLIVEKIYTPEVIEVQVNFGHLRRVGSNRLLGPWRNIAWVEWLGLHRWP